MVQAYYKNYNLLYAMTFDMMLNALDLFGMPLLIHLMAETQTHLKPQRNSSMETIEYKMVLKCIYNII